MNCPFFKASQDFKDAGDCVDLFLQKMRLVHEVKDVSEYSVTKGNFFDTAKQEIKLSRC